MDRTRAVDLQRGLMTFGRISPIVFEIVNGVALMIRLHQQIAIDLRHDGSRGNGDTSPVAFDQWNLRHFERFQHHGIQKKYVGANRKVFDGVLHRELARAKNVDAIDRRCFDDADGDGACAAKNQPADGHAILGIDLLGVVDAEESGLAVEDDAGGDDGTGETAAADLIRSGDGAKTKIAEPALHH